MMKTALVTGASSGFGKDIAEHLVNTGYRVVGTSRSAPADVMIAEQGLTMARLDVCDDTSVADLHRLLVANDALPDLLILNAGIAIAGAIEETSIELAQQQMETNFFGVHRLVGAFVSQMRVNGAGQVIVIGSLAAQITVPFQGFYSASKAAISSYTQALRMETAAFGLRVSLIEPGDHKTEVTANRISAAPAQGGGYEPQGERAVAIMEKSESYGPPASLVADLVLKIVASKAPKFRYLQIQSSERSTLIMKWLMSAQRFEKIIMGYFRVPTEKKSS